LVPRLTKAKANPCAAKNPCNPSGAKNPCAASDDITISNAEAVKAYACIRPVLQTAYGKSGNSVALAYTKWKDYSAVPYPSSTHGGRFVRNYANPKGANYGKFEKSGIMPQGTVLAKDSFSVTKTGAVAPGPLFLMEKMGRGFNKASGNWRYTMIMPNGTTFGVTKGKNSAGMKFCTECHAAVGENQDHMFFLPEEFRSK
jgi:hypothetical protein